MKPEHTSAMIALVPERPAALALSGGEAPEELHVTLKYLGPAAEIPPEVVTGIKTHLAQAAPKLSLYEGEAFSINHFNPLGDDPALTLGVGGRWLPEVHLLATAALYERIGDGSWEAPENHVPWVPHLTLAYHPVAEMFTEALDKLGGIMFDRIRYAHAGDTFDYKLGTPIFFQSTYEALASGGGAMPWHVVHNHSSCSASEPWAVVKDSDGSVAGCHSTEASANEQLAALYASETADAKTVTVSVNVPEGTPPAKLIDLGREAGITLANQIYNPTTHTAGANTTFVPLEGGTLEVEMIRDATKLDVEIPTFDTTAPNVVAWHGPLVTEGEETGDGREFSVGSLTWELPVPLQFQPKMKPAHEDAEVVGRIDTIERLADRRLWGEGVLDLGCEWGREVARRMGYNAETGEITENVFAGGVSIDVDSIKEYDVELVYRQDDDEGVEKQDDVLLTLFGPKPDKVIYHRGRIRAATMVAIPAFIGAKLTLKPVEEESLVAAGALAEVAPMYPPAAWFRNPGLDAPTPFTITDDGRVFGHLAVWGTCHTTFSDRCLTPPKGSTYDYFARAELKCEDGSLVGVGPITMGTGHAGAGGIGPAVKHYDDTGTAVCDITAGEDRYGIWVSGSLRPNLDALAIRQLRGACLSGDWRRIGGRLRLVAVLAVNVPGYPIPRMSARFDSDDLISLVAAGVPTPQRIDKLLHPGDGLGTIRVRKVV